MDDKLITITFTGDQATGKSRFMRALELHLKMHGVEVVNMAERSENGAPHTMQIRSKDAFKFAEQEGF